jgi:hypothetical protein
MEYEIEVAIEKNRVRNKNQYSIIMSRYPPALHWTNMARIAIQWRANEASVENKWNSDRKHDRDIRAHIRVALVLCAVMLNDEMLCGGNVGFSVLDNKPPGAGSTKAPGHFITSKNKEDCFPQGQRLRD